MSGEAKTAWTPGPWGFDASGARLYRADGDVEPTIGWIELENTSDERFVADGTLAAAAPELYEALNAIAEFAPDQNCGKDPYVQIAAFAKSTARAALSRALPQGTDTPQVHQDGEQGRE